MSKPLENRIALVTGASRGIGRAAALAFAQAGAHVVAVARTQGGLEELDDLDLDTSLDSAVTVVEWGEGVAEGLADSRLEVRIVRSLAVQGEDGDARRVEITPVGPRWAGVALSELV